MTVRLLGLVVATLAVCVVLYLSAVRPTFYFSKEESTFRQSITLPSGTPIPVLPPMVSARTEDPRQPEPRAIQARATAIIQSATVIESECPGGDWQKWQRDTSPFRASLKAKIDALRNYPPDRSDYPEGRYEALQGQPGFPLFEVGSREHLNYLYDPASLDEFRRARPVVAAQRWLHSKGIDLLFVPVPKMTEVYIEQFVDPCPPNGIIAPHVRNTLLELLKADVEVVDGWSLFRPLRDADSEYLYNTADTHWAPRGMRIMAKEIANRIERYKFGARARYALPLFITRPGHYLLDGIPGGIGSAGGWQALSPAQVKIATAAQTMVLSEVTTQDGQPPEDDRASPVLLIGNSYVRKFREQLIKELNLLVQTRDAANLGTEAFADFLREPDLLAHTRVVVWITTEQHMTNFRRMPSPILPALSGK
jgi:hypothetical protein